MFFSRLTTFQSLTILLAVSLTLKIAMAMVLPITGDEAYFIQWGNYPDFGYYDHPPMVGWWLSWLLGVSDAPLWLRMPTIAITTLIGWLIFILVKPYSKTNALIAAGMYWLAPVTIVAPLMTTDTPLIFWSFLSALCFYKAQRRDNYLWYLLAGIMLGLAFLSKFFAGMLGVAFFLYIVLFVRRGIRPYLGVAIIFIGTLPAIGLNLYWNYLNCWDNYLFNLFNRTTDFEFSFTRFLTYVLFLIYLISPPAIFYLWRKPGKLIETIKNGRQGMFLAMFLIPIALFVFLSFGKNIGLHWLLSFYPFLFIAIVYLLHFGQLRVCFYFTWGFTLLHVLALSMVVAFSPGILSKFEKLQKEAIYMMQTPDILKTVAGIIGDMKLATPSYSQSALLSYYSHKHVIVLGAGSYHGRQDDIITDMRNLDKKSIAILSFKKDVTAYSKYFDSFTHFVIPQGGREFYLGVGTGFKYEVYREDVLTVVKLKFYTGPEWFKAGRCDFNARYGFE